MTHASGLAAPDRPLPELAATLDDALTQWARGTGDPMALVEGVAVDLAAHGQHTEAKALTAALGDYRTGHGDPLAVVADIAEWAARQD